MKINNLFEGFITMVAVLALICLLLGAPVMLLWNWTLPNIFEGVPKIGFWQAVGLNLLCSFLFKSNVTIQKD